MNGRKYGPHETEYKKNRAKIFRTQSICAICGKPVDFSLKYPHPLSPSCDHIVPVNSGGHLSDINNLQLAHLTCNRAKSDKFVGDEDDAKAKRKEFEVKGNRNLPLSVSWL